ncbi:hypothetical protein C2G38_2199052 [Gigaspora rosea]|uniref:Uncharacterized protein n=1 Tax=Gigaspora rosea TaxID=44941 RepID=A0A397US42_9GLOM|nr:hypothetical protein C2G38_2199052 [Gigaspora rosea]
MRILPATARETKSQFFEKRGWTLHTTLVFQKDEDDNNLNINVYDHWSTDTKQGAWFIASCFKAVFMTMDPRPQWIKIISDNGEHHHNSEIGCDLIEGTNIEEVLQNLSGTSVAHIEPNRNQADIEPDLESLKPSPIFSTSSTPKSAWNPELLTNKKINKELSSVNNNNNELAEMSDTTRGNNLHTPYNIRIVDQDFPLNVGWALKENMKFGNKGARKHIKKKVLQYLQGFFLAGNLKAADRYSPKDMHADFEDLARNGEISVEDIPTVKTIKGWIGRYSASFKKEASERALTEASNDEHALVYNTGSSRTNKCQKERTSKNKNVDDCIKEFQLKATQYENVIEWIPFNRLDNIQKIREGFSANWLDVELKILYSFQNSLKEYLNSGLKEIGIMKNEQTATDITHQELGVGPTKYENVIEWIHFNRLDSVQKIGDKFSAIWLDGKQCVDGDGLKRNIHNHVHHHINGA